MTDQAPPQSLSPETKVSSESSASKTNRPSLFAGRSGKLIAIVAATAMIGLLTAQLLPTQMAIATALTVFCIGCWATGAVPEYWPALIFFLVAMLFKIAPAEVVFSGFYSSTFWLLFSGLVLGAALKHTGLGARVAAMLSDTLGTGYSGIIAVIVLFSLALAFVMPSAIGRMVLLIPIVVALADQMSYTADDNGRIGMLAATAFGTWLPAFSILPSNTPNMILAGMAEALYGHNLTYWEYLLVHFPVLGAVKAGVLILLILWLFPDRDPISKPTLQPNPAPMNTAERRLATVLGLCLALWLTDNQHHIAPGWISLAAALYCLWPYANLTSKNCINEEIKCAPLLFVAGIIGLGAVLSTTGVGEVVVDKLSAHAGFADNTPVWNFTALTAISTLVAIVTNLPGVPAVMTPIAEQLSAVTGMSLGAVLMIQVLAFSNVLLPYQAPPLLTAMQLGQIPARAIIKLCLALFTVTSLVLIPLDLLWWQLIGKL